MMIKKTIMVIAAMELAEGKLEHVFS